MMPWFENEHFWESTYPMMFETRMEVAQEETEKILKLAGNINGPVLDLCCGPGPML